MERDVPGRAWAGGVGGDEGWAQAEMLGFPEDSADPLPKGPMAAVHPQGDSWRPLLHRHSGDQDVACDPELHWHRRIKGHTGEANTWDARPYEKHRSRS